MAWLDRLGLTASIGCAIHCLATGLFFLILPGLFEFSHHSSFLGLNNSVWIHGTLALIVVPVAIYSLSRGYRVHKRSSTLLFGTAGLALLTAGLLVHPDPLETPFTFVGGILLALAHFINLKGIKLNISN